METAENPKRTKNVPILHEVNGLVSTAEDKAGASLEIKYLYNKLEDEDLHFTEEVEYDFKDEPEFGQLALSSPDEVIGINKYLSAKKTPGRNNISNRAIKHLPLKTTVYLTATINEILGNQYFPRLWKQVEVIMILKPNRDPKFPQNYRPISLLPAISKIEVRIIIRR